jgi:hypothetical protein
MALWRRGDEDRGRTRYRARTPEQFDAFVKTIRYPRYYTPDFTTAEPDTIIEETGDIAALMRQNVTLLSFSRHGILWSRFAR